MMNNDKFEHFIPKRANSVDPLQWDLLHKMGTRVVDHIVEDDDQGPSKEQRCYEWDCQLSTIAGTDCKGKGGQKCLIRTCCTCVSGDFFLIIC